MGPVRREQPRFKRHPFAILAGLSILLSIGFAVAWLMTIRITFENPSMPSPDIYIVGSIPALGWLSLFSLAIAIAAYGGLTKDRRRRSWRLENDRCVNCGYDLRESPDRCPECGAVKETRKSFTSRDKDSGK
jgi:hypothetical protein